MLYWHEIQGHTQKWQVNWKIETFQYPVRSIQLNLRHLGPSLLIVKKFLEEHLVGGSYRSSCGHLFSKCVFSREEHPSSYFFALADSRGRRMPSISYDMPLLTCAALLILYPVALIVFGVYSHFHTVMP